MKAVNPVIPISVQIAVPVYEKLAVLMDKHAHNKKQAIEAAICVAFDAMAQRAAQDVLPPASRKAREPEPAPEPD